MHAPDAARLAARRRARTTSRAAAPTSRSSSRHGLPRAGPRIRAGRRPAHRGAIAGVDEHHALGVLLAGALEPPWLARRAAARPTSSRPRRCSARCSSAARRLVGARRPRTGRSCIPGARRRSRARRGEPLRLASSASCTRWSRGAGTWRAAAFAIDLGSARERSRPRSSRYQRPFGAFPPLRQDLAVVLARGVAARSRCSQLVRAAARRAARATCEVFDVYRGAQVGEGRRSLALALSFRAPDRTLTDEDVAPRARADRRRAGASWGVSCVAEPSRLAQAVARRASRRGCSSPAPPALPARSPRTCSGAIPRFELVAVTGRSEVGRRLDDLYPRYRVPLSSSSSTSSSRLDATRRRLDAAIVAYPHAAAAPTVGALRERGVRVVDLSADFRLRALATLRAVVWRAPPPRAARRRPCTG